MYVSAVMELIGLCGPAAGRVAGRSRWAPTRRTARRVCCTSSAGAASCSTAALAPTPPGSTARCCCTPQKAAVPTSATPAISRRPRRCANRCSRWAGRPTRPRPGRAPLCRSSPHPAALTAPSVVHARRGQPPALRSGSRRCERPRRVARTAASDAGHVARGGVGRVVCRRRAVARTIGGRPRERAGPRAECNRRGTARRPRAARALRRGLATVDAHAADGLGGDAPRSIRHVSTAAARTARRRPARSCRAAAPPRRRRRRCGAPTDRAAPVDPALAVEPSRSDVAAQDEGRRAWREQWRCACRGRRPARPLALLTGARQRAAAVAFLFLAATARGRRREPRGAAAGRPPDGGPRSRLLPPPAHDGAARM